MGPIVSYALLSWVSQKKINEIDNCWWHSMWSDGLWCYMICIDCDEANLVWSDMLYLPQFWAEKRNYQIWIKIDIDILSCRFLAILMSQSLFHLIRCYLMVVTTFKSSPLISLAPHQKIFLYSWSMYIIGTPLAQTIISFNANYVIYKWFKKSKIKSNLHKTQKTREKHKSEKTEEKSIYIVAQ